MSQRSGGACRASAEVPVPAGGRGQRLMEPKLIIRPNGRAPIRVMKNSCRVFKKSAVQGGHTVWNVLEVKNSNMVSSSQGVCGGAKPRKSRALLRRALPSGCRGWGRDYSRNHSILKAVGGRRLQHGAVGHLLSPEGVEGIHQVGALRKPTPYSSECRPWASLRLRL